jgi:hypothetical protein
MRTAEPATIAITAFWFETEGSTVSPANACVGSIAYVGSIPKEIVQGSFGIPWPSPADEAGKKRVVAADSRMAVAMIGSPKIEPQSR